MVTLTSRILYTDELQNWYLHWMIFFFFLINSRGIMSFSYFSSPSLLYTYIIFLFFFPVISEPDFWGQTWSASTRENILTGIWVLLCLLNLHWSCYYRSFEKLYKCLGHAPKPVWVGRGSPLASVCYYFVRTWSQLFSLAFTLCCHMMWIFKGSKWIYSMFFFSLDSWLRYLNLHSCRLRFVH